MQKLSKFQPELLGSKFKVRDIRSVSSAFGFHRVVLLIAEHRYGQKGHAMVDGFDQAMNAAVRDEQSAIWMV